MIEILTIHLRPGTRDQFHQLYISQSLPLQKKWKIDVVTHGPSLHDDSTYYAVRSFNSLEDRKEKEEAFYASDDWQHGPRKAMLALIENLENLVVTVDTLEGWVKAIQRQA
jgi:hypothetical protein